MRVSGEWWCTGRWVCVKLAGAMQSWLWHGLLTVPPEPTAGLPSMRDQRRPSVGGRGRVRRPCHNGWWCTGRWVCVKLAGAMQSISTTHHSPPGDSPFVFGGRAEPFFGSPVYNGKIVSGQRKPEWWYAVV